MNQLWIGCFRNFSFDGSELVWVKADDELKSVITGFLDIMGHMICDSCILQSLLLFLTHRFCFVLVTNPCSLFLEACHVWSWGNTNYSQGSYMNTAHLFKSDHNFFKWIFIVVFKLEHAYYSNKGFQVQNIAVNYFIEHNSLDSIFIYLFLLLNTGLGSLMLCFFNKEDCSLSTEVHNTGIGGGVCAWVTYRRAASLDTMLSSQA